MLAIVIVTFACIPCVYGQSSTTGAIRGRVLEASGAPVADAQITAVNSATGLVRSTRSNAKGQYGILLLPPGEYTVKASRIGFLPFVRGNFVTRTTDVSTLNVTLATVATQLQTVDVKAQQDRQIDARQTGVAEYVSEKEIQRLPALGRDFTDFIALSGLVSPQPEVSTGGTVAIGGDRSSGVNLQVDGADANFNFFGESRGGARIPFTFSLESIKEFQLITNGYDVEYGNYSSGVVNVVTRGGTNTFRASALGYMRADWLTNHNFAFKGDSIFRPDEFQVQQYAASLSGPIVRDKLHFLVSLDGQRRRDPFEAASPRGLGVSQSTIDRFTTDLSTIYGQVGAKNEFGRFEKTDDVNVLFGRLDWTLNASNRISFRTNYANYLSQNDGLQFGGSRPRTSGSDFKDKNLSIVTEVTSVLPGSAFNVFRAQFADEKRPRVSNNFLPAITVLDVEGTNDIFYGSSGITFRNNLDEQDVQLIDNITVARGRHTFKVGTNNMFRSIYNQFWNNGNGSYEFASMADFEARKPSRFSRSLPLTGAHAPEVRYGTKELSFYGQDEWQVTNRLLMTAGLRYDLNRYDTDFPQVAAVDSLFVNRGESFRTGNAPNDDNNVSPRLSFAFDVLGNQRHVLRAGAGLFFGRVPGVLGSNVGIGADPVLSLDCRNAAAPAPDFANFGARGENIPATCAGSAPAALTGTREYTFWGTNFQYPETYKYNAGYEGRLARRTTFSADVLYSRTDKNFTVVDLSLPLTPVASVTSEGKRGIYVPLAKYNPRNAAATADRSRFAGINRIYVNDNQGVEDTFAATFRLDQSIGNTKLRASYTRNWAKDNSSFTCCTSSAGFSGDNNDGDAGKKGGRGSSAWGPTSFVRPHTVVLSGISDLPFGFSMSGIFRATSGTSFTPSVSGDLNGDGNSGNDLPFIGKPADMAFQTPADADTYNRLLSENKCLSDAVGGFAHRNTCPNPWQYQFDMSFKKAFRLQSSGRQLELVADFFNVLNGLNSDWGQLTRVGQSRILSAQSYDATSGKVKYTVNTNFGQKSFIGPVRQFQTQLGIRVTY